MQEERSFWHGLKRSIARWQAGRAAAYLSDFHLRQTHTPKQAEGAARRAVWLSPDYAEGFLVYGNTLYGQHRLDEAIAKYRHAVSLDASLGVAHRCLAQTLYERAVEKGLDTS